MNQPFDVLNQFWLNALMGAGFATLNYILLFLVRKSVPAGPPWLVSLMTRPLISVTRWLRWTWAGFLTSLIGIYLFWFVFQLITSPLFRSLLESVYTELARSIYQAPFMMVGILAIDLIALAITGMTRLITSGRAGAQTVAANVQAAAAGLTNPADTPAPETTEPVSAVSQRLDERLGKY